MEFGFFAILILEILFILFAGYLIFSWLTKTPYYPSRKKDLNNLFKKLNLNSSHKFLDIGSGDGRVVLLASKYVALAHGIEYNPFLSLYARLKIFLRLKRNSKIFNKNFNNFNFSEYNFIYVYLYPKHVSKIYPKLISELPNNSIIVSNTFEIKDLKYTEKFNKFYIYKITK